MASRSLDTRARLLAALQAGGLRTATTGKFSAPVVLVEVGDPWSEPATLQGLRVTRWRLSAVVGRTDSEGAIAGLGELVDAIDAALVPAGIQLPTWGQPFSAQLDGAAYATTVATVQLMTEEASG